MSDGKKAMDDKTLSRATLKVAEIAARLTVGFDKVIFDDLEAGSAILPPPVWMTAVVSALGFIRGKLQAFNEKRGFTEEGLDKVFESALKAGKAEEVAQQTAAEVKQHPSTGCACGKCTPEEISSRNAIVATLRKLGIPAMTVAEYIEMIQGQASGMSEEEIERAKAEIEREELRSSGRLPS